MGLLKLSRQINCRLIRPRFVNLVLPIANYVAAGQTIGVKIRICLFDDENVQCNDLRALQLCKNLQAITRKYTTILITRDI